MIRQENFDPLGFCSSLSFKKRVYVLATPKRHPKSEARQNIPQSLRGARLNPPPARHKAATFGREVQEKRGGGE